ncbi:monocarboxylate transporter 9-like [Patiria miniata]|uniref:Major facilitator superfamily (MFS) profile domain-containing protein n=1 Tax=Patiria miniata TaxID=46514 RepID=A0A913ZZG5_PATMI|nr:monocarboxylate transporter 9-like [Patiria miniata]XP_038056968.1 monocarboxylate transporter 9-like [Patiria miniata]
MAQELDAARQQRKIGVEWCMRDGGRIGWSAVLSLWTTWFVWDSLIKCLAVMLPTLTVQLQTPTWMLGGIIAIVDGIAEGSGTLVFPLSKCMGTGCIIVVCGIAVGGGIIAASFVTSAIQLAIILTTTAGFGIGVSGILARHIIGTSFSKQYVMASGWAQTGDSVAYIVMPPFTHLCLITYGWRGNLLIVGAICMHLAVCGALLKRYKEPRRKDETSPLLPPARNPSDCEMSSERRPTCENKHIASNRELFTNPFYWITLLISSGTHLTSGMWRIYFVPHAIAKGVASHDAALFVTIAGVVTLILKIVHGPLVDGGYVSCRVLMGIAAFIPTAGLIIDPWMNSNWQIICCGIMVLPFVGVSFNLTDVITKELLGKDQLVNAFGWLGLKAALLRIIVGFIPGWIYDQTGSYDAAFVMIGFLESLSLIGLIVLMYVTRSTKKDNPV